MPARLTLTLSCLTCLRSQLWGLCCLLLLLLPSPAISLGFTILLLLRSQLYLWGSPFFFFFVPSYISGVHHSSSSAFPSYISGVHHSSSSSFPSYISGVHHSSSSSFPAISLGFTILLLLRSPARSLWFTMLGESFAYVTCFCFCFCFSPTIQVLVDGACHRWVNAGNKNAPGMHHSRRRNMTTSLVG